MADWAPLQKILIEEFHPSKFVDHASAWLKNPITNIHQADPIVIAIWFCLAYSVIVYILAFFTKNYSWVDKSWSLLPGIYAWLMVACIPTTQKDLVPRILELIAKHPRPLLMAVLATLWGARLTYNFARKGGYTWSGEDYRWKYILSYKFFHTFLGKVAWELFSISFIALYQNILIMLFSIPIYVVYKHTVTAKSDGLNIFDIVLAGLWMLLLAFETIADQQQWNYYTRREKYRALSKTEQQSKKDESSDEARGFNSSGVFAHSRHPNYFAEQSLWIVYYLFSVSATGQPLNWTIAGSVLLVLLFMGSTWLTELITCSKYPAYKAYIRSVPGTIPSLTARKIEWKAE